MSNCADCKFAYVDNLYAEWCCSKGHVMSLDNDEDYLKDFECDDFVSEYETEDNNMIKDSGDRTEFETGFVRDMHEGKGRFDLLPWHAIWDVAKHCEEGALKYGERNIDKGAPQHSLIDSGMRHLAKYVMGYRDEDHLRAAAWNILWALEQDATKPELIDIPAAKKEKETE